MAKKLFWMWLIILFLLNVIPLGNEVNEQLQKGWGVGILRMDYLAHALTFLCFAGIYILKYLRRELIFRAHELVKVISFILISAILFEVAQYVLPYRAWNLLDLIYNLLGAIIASLIILVFNQRQLKTMSASIG